MSDKKKSKATRFGERLGGDVTIVAWVFLILKLTHNIDWSWWWVLSPTIFSFGLLALALLVVGAAETLDARR